MTLDMRGYNESEKPAGLEAYSVPDVAEVITALGYEHCTLVGHDWGGAIAARSHNSP